MRNGGPAFCGKSIILNRWRNRAYRKRAIFEVFCALFWPSFLEGGFCRLCCHVSWQHVEEGDRRETRRNNRFRSDFASLSLFDSFWRLENARICWPFLRIISSACYYFVFFEARILTNLGLEGKKALGAAEPSSFWKAFSHFVRCARKFDAQWARGRVRFSFGVGVIAKNALAVAVRRVFASFSLFFCPTPFSQTSSASLQAPLFLFRCLCLFFAFFLGLGATQPCTCVFKLAFNPSYY